MSETSEGFDVLDRVARDHRLLAVAVDQGERPVVLVDDQTAQHAAVPQGDGLGLIFLADQGAGVDQARQQEIEIAALGAGQVGADRLAFIEELVADGAVFLEDRLAASGVALVPLG